MRTYTSIIAGMCLFHIFCILYYVYISNCWICLTAYSHYTFPIITHSLLDRRSASFETAFCFPTSFSFSNRLQHRMDPVFPLSYSSFASFNTVSRSCLSQTSNGNDPWSVWNSDPSGGSNNNWMSNPEGAQTGRDAADPWGSISQGHPQAYQGPGMKNAKPLPILCL